MRHPTYVRSLQDTEHQTLRRGLHSSVPFTIRRCQIVLASAEQQSVPQIAKVLKCTEQTIRNAIHAFNAHGLAALKPGSSRPHQVKRAFTPETAERLRTVLHQSPRAFGKATSLWTLPLVAEVSFAQGLTPTLVTGETIRLTLARLGVKWKRAKRWLTSPDSAYTRKKTHGTV